MRFREASTAAVIMLAFVAPALGAGSQNANKSQQVTVQPAVTRPVQPIVTRPAQPKQPAERFKPVTKLGVMSRPAREAKERFEFVQTEKELKAKFKAGDEQAGIKLHALYTARLKEQESKKREKEERNPTRYKPVTSLGVRNTPLQQGTVTTPTGQPKLRTPQPSSTNTAMDRLN